MELSAWLSAAKVTHVAMEATGVYWKPAWHVLCHDFKLILANASHIRNVPGRKSDANDASWIADLLAHGLIRASFVPPQPIQELRDLTRTRRELTREIVRHTQRNVKRWQDGDMRKRWTAAGMLVAEQQFRRIIGYRDLAKLVIAIERHTILIANNNRDRHQTREPVTV